MPWLKLGKSVGIDVIIVAEVSKVVVDADVDIDVGTDVDTDVGTDVDIDVDTIVDRNSKKSINVIDDILQTWLWIGLKN